MVPSRLDVPMELLSELLQKTRGDVSACAAGALAPATAIATAHVRASPRAFRVSTFDLSFMGQPQAWPAPPEKTSARVADVSRAMDVEASRRAHRDQRGARAAAIGRRGRRRRTRAPLRRWLGLLRLLADALDPQPAGVSGGLSGER
jgi:hypothetical protein